MSINREIGEKDVVHIHNGVLLSQKKNELTPLAATWRDLEMIALSEVKSDRQSGKDKYHMISLTQDFPGSVSGE